MKNDNSVEKFRSYAFSQSKHQSPATAAIPAFLPNPCITISYQTGVDVPDISTKLEQLLQRTWFESVPPWKIFNHEIIEQALHEERWPKKMAEQITETKRLFVEELMDDLCGLRPPSWVLIPRVVHVISALAKEGRVILVGHGATVVTAKMANVFHVRLTGSLAKRAEYLQADRGLTAERTATYIRRTDQRRDKFLRTHFKARLNDELLYDLTVNTDRLSNDDATTLIYEGAKRFFLRG